MATLGHAPLSFRSSLTVADGARVIDGVSRIGEIRARWPTDYNGPDDPMSTEATSQGAPPTPGPPSDAEIEEYRQLAAIFLPHAHERSLQTYPERPGSAKFAHYTSASAAMQIIETKRFWMRNAMCMADYSEVNHGFELLRKALAAEAGFKALEAALDQCVPGVARQAVETFDHHLLAIRTNTYIACVSEHDAVKEDLHGRLSMWRAFGNTGTRVALVLSVPWYSSASWALSLTFSPVAYLSDSEVAAEVASVIESIRASAQFLRGVDPTKVRATVFQMLLTATTCLKHEGFAEEREWRAIYEPTWTPPHSKGLMECSTRCMNGVPQHVYEIPVDVTRSPDLADIDLARMFERLIIGPTQYPLAVRDAFVDALTKAGVQDAGARVFISGIPIRT